MIEASMTRRPSTPWTRNCIVDDGKSDPIPSCTSRRREKTSSRSPECSRASSSPSLTLDPAPIPRRDTRRVRVPPRSVGQSRVRERARRDLPLGKVVGVNQGGILGMPLTVIGSARGSPGASEQREAEGVLSGTGGQENLDVGNGTILRCLDEGADSNAITRQGSFPVGVVLANALSSIETKGLFRLVRESDPRMILKIHCRHPEDRRTTAISNVVKCSAGPTPESMRSLR